LTDFSLFPAAFMFDHLAVKRIMLEGLVESGHDYADLRRRMGHPMGAHDLTVIHRVDFQLQEAEANTEKVQVLREDVDRLYELRRRMKWLDRSLTSRIFSYYTVASYVLLFPFVAQNACIVILAPLVAWTIPFFLYTSFTGELLAGARLLSMFILGLWVSWCLTESLWLGMALRRRMILMLVAWLTTGWLMLSQFEAREFRWMQ
jgi:hypothetical protein